MSRRGKDLTPDVRKIIVSLFKKAYSGHKIAKITEVNPKTVNIF